MGRLIKRTVEAAEIRATDYFVFDDELSGFGLRVMPSVRKIFVLQYRAGIKSRRATLGQYPVLTAEKALVEATRLLAAVREGRDLSGEKQMRAVAPTVCNLAERFKETHCATRLKPKTRERYIELIDNTSSPP